MMVSLIVAMSENGVIGRDGGMPWHLRSDLRRFRLLTMGHHIIMGRRTHQSIGRLLPGRTTIVISRNPKLKIDGAQVTHSVQSALELAADDPEVFVTGGAEIYRLALPLVSQMFVTRVHTEVEGDTVFPEVNWDDWELTAAEQDHADAQNDHDFTFETWERLGQEPGEQQMIA